MTEKKKLGKILHVAFGFGGYQDAQMAVEFTLDMQGTRVNDSHGFWAKRSDHCEWTVEDQRNGFADTVEYIRELIRAAHVTKLHELRGMPVEVTLNGNRLVSWRILEEVL